MKNQLSFFLSICLIFLLSSCYSAPKEMPDDFTISYQFSGGMSPTYKTITIKIGECKFKSRMNDDDQPLEYSFQLKRDDLVPLYNDLRAINAFTLKSKKQKVYDRGGVSISYTINKKIFHVSNSGMSFVIGAHQKAFSKSEYLISTFVDKYRP